MMRTRALPTLLAAGLATLAGCADAPTAVARAPLAPRDPARSLSASDMTAARHLVRVDASSDAFAAAVAALGGTVDYHHTGAGLAIVGGLTAEAAARLAARDDVAEVHADVALTVAPTRRSVVAMDGDVGAMSVANPATAIRYSWQWNMRAIGAQHAWAAGKLGSPNVTVAILDSGIDYNALDLNGLVDLTRSVSFVPSDDALRNQYFPTRHVSDDFSGHGTNVATQASSIAVAHAGVTSRTRLMSVKVLGANGTGSLSGMLQGVLYATDHGADVINMSLGLEFERAGGAGGALGLFGPAFGYAHRRGALVVAAAGNSAIDLDRNLIPDAYGELQRTRALYSLVCDAPNVLCVSATGPETVTGSPDVPAFYTNFGRSTISVAAPGGNAGSTATVWPWGAGSVSWIWSMCAKNYLPNPATPAVRPCASGGAVFAAIGTSQASPHAAGLAALLVAEMGPVGPAQLKARIQQSAVDLGQPGTDPYFGRGRIDVRRALGL